MILALETSGNSRKPKETFRAANSPESWLVATARADGRELRAKMALGKQQDRRAALRSGGEEPRALGVPGLGAAQRAQA